MILYTINSQSYGIIDKVLYFVLFFEYPQQRLIHQFIDYFLKLMFYVFFPIKRLLNIMIYKYKANISLYNQFILT